MTEIVVDISNIPVSIYTRDVSPNWYVRVRLPGDGRYRRKSLGTTELETAKMLAMQHYYELMGKVQAGIKLDGINFADAATLYKNDLKAQLERGEADEKKVLQYSAVVDRYHTAFFGDKQIDLITNKDIAQYQTWRKTYWTKGPGAKVDYITYVRKGRTYKRPVDRNTPSPSTLRIENIPLRAVFSMATIHGWTSKERVPEIKDPKTRDTQDTRSALTEEQYHALLDVIPGWIAKATIGKQRYFRKMMRFWLPVMVGTGMRVGKESASVRWRDFRHAPAANGNEATWQLVIREGKTADSQRRIVMRKQTAEALLEWRRITPHPEDDDFIFCNQNGTALKEFRETFASLCEDAGVLEDEFGRKFTPYSLRHTYITFMLRKQVDVWVIAKNCGTSPEMIRRFYSKNKIEEFAHALAGDGTGRFLKQPPDEHPIKEYSETAWAKKSDAMKAKLEAKYTIMIVADDFL